jgi:hypothetical protein
MPFTVHAFAVETFDGRNFKLLESVDYFTEVRGKLEKVTLPAGAESDGASIPRQCWNIPGFQPFGLHWRAAFVHDCGYRNALSHDGPEFTRFEVDGMFHEAMGNAGVDPIHREAIYTAVRAFGELAWRNGHKLK